ncbi:hypothetical protein TCAL_15307 [Tigriopus californicus]|uniref:Uncharacterized protein n=1 Tax=Tigriopus californicus TaxID=6832 RepID=A0A553PME7_TIGCA|nr:hypothetical protein TCAL_15307 [Tigriopus californicus]
MGTPSKSLGAGPHFGEVITHGGQTATNDTVDIGANQVDGQHEIITYPTHYCTKVNSCLVMSCDLFESVQLVSEHDTSSPLQAPACLVLALIGLVCIVGITLCTHPYLPATSWMLQKTTFLGLVPSPYLSWNQEGRAKEINDRPTDTWLDYIQGQSIASQEKASYYVESQCRKE